MRRSGQFAVAERLYRRALASAGLSEDARLEASIQLGACLMLQGRLYEALACFGEVHAQARREPLHFGCACRALRYHVNVLQRIHDSDDPANLEANADSQFKMIDEGLAWLRSIGKELWQGGFLYHRALVEMSLGSYEQAFDTAEKAWRYAQSPGGECAYLPTDHIAMVAYCSRQTKRFERALAVLDEADNYCESSFDEIRIRLERARTYRAMSPAGSVDALEEARQAARQVRAKEAPRTKLLVHEELAFSALSVSSVAEAWKALDQVRQIALENATVDRRFMVRRALACFAEASRILAGSESPEGHNLVRRIEKWSKDFEDAASSEMPADSSALGQHGTGLNR